GAALGAQGGLIVNVDAVPERELLASLVEHGHLIPTGVPGVFGRGRDFEGFVERFERLVGEVSKDDHADFRRFPPVIPRKDFERSEFLKGFPHLAGSIFSFEGDTRKHQQMLERIEQGADWTEFQTMTDVVLAPAACYPIYPTCTGVLP